MGANGSKEGEANFDRGSTLSLSSRRKSSRVDEIQSITDTIKRIKDEIEYYTGTRADPRYVECQKILADLSSKLQDLKKSGKRKSTVVIDDILDDIKVCFRLLEEKVNSNEADQNLDMASIESHSFINQNVKKFETVVKPEFHGSMDSIITSPGYHPKKEKPKYRPISTVDLLEQQIENLEKEVRIAVELEDTKQFIVLEKKIQILYTDLEMIHADPHTPISERKEGLERRLIKSNNQIKKSRRHLERKSKTSSQIDSTPSVSSVSEVRPTVEVKTTSEIVNQDHMDDIARIRRELEEYLLKAQTYAGTRQDNNYKRLVQILETYWSNVYNTEEFSNIDRTRKVSTIEKIKTILKKLEAKAEQNENLVAAKTDINRIENELEECVRHIRSFRGEKEDELYTSLDQKLRSLWDDLGRINVEDDNVQKRKNVAIDTVREELKNLREKLKQNIKNAERAQVLVHQGDLGDDYHPHKLLKQAEEFRNHWNQLEYNFNRKKINNKEQLQKIIVVLEEVVEAITFNVNEFKVAAETFEVTTKQQNSNEPDSLEKKFISSKVDNNYVLDTRNYKKPDLISSEKDLQNAIKNDLSNGNIQTLVSADAVAEIQKLRLEAKELNKQVDTLDISNEKEYLRLKNELRQLQDTIGDIISNGSETISSHKTNTEELIRDGLIKLKVKRSEYKNAAEQNMKSKIAVTTIDQEHGRVSVSKALQEIMEIDANVQYLQKQIQKFEGITTDAVYEKIETGLQDCHQKLLSIEVSGYDNLSISKNEIFQQIDKYNRELQDKLTANQRTYRNSNPNLANITSEDLKRQTSHELKSVIEQVQKLKAQVERFSGIYKGIQYKQIEDGLANAAAKLEDLDANGNEKVKNAKVQTGQKIDQYLKILEEKSLKVNKDSTETTAEVKKVKEEIKADEETETPPKVHDSSNPLVISFQQIEALRNKLVIIKDAVESFEGIYKDTKYVRFENELLDCKKDIEDIKDHGHASIITSKNQYIEYIDKLLKYFEDKMKNANEEDTLDKNPLEEMKNAEDELEQLSNDIYKFERSQGETVLKTLDEALTKLIEKIELIDTGNLTHLIDRKNKMLLDVQKAVNLLNDKAQYMLQFPEELQQILNELEFIFHSVYTFSGTRYDKKYVELDEALIQLMMRVRSIDTRTNSIIADECVRAIQKIQEAMKLLQEKVRIPGLDDKAPIVHNLGTFV